MFIFDFGICVHVDDKLAVLIVGPPCVWKSVRLGGMDDIRSNCGGDRGWVGIIFVGNANIQEVQVIKNK